MGWLCVLQEVDVVMGWLLMLQEVGVTMVTDCIQLKLVYERMGAVGWLFLCLPDHACLLVSVR